MPDPVSAAPAAIPSWLREVLRCPQCRSELLDGSGPGGPELHCTDPTCRLAYRIDGGIPVLLVDEARRRDAEPATPEAPPPGS